MILAKRGGHFLIYIDSITSPHVFTDVMVASIVYPIEKGTLGMSPLFFASRSDFSESSEKTKWRPNWKSNQGPALSVLSANLCALLLFRAPNYRLTICERMLISSLDLLLRLDIMIL